MGLITPQAASSPGRDGLPACTDCLAHFTDRARDLGLRIKNRWIRVAQQDESDRDAARRGPLREAYGYEQFTELWRQPERPDGLIVDEDVTARGVITALLERQVRVPEDLKLVLYKNEAIELLCPKPVTFVVGSERAMVRALLDLIEKQFRSERCEPIILSYQVVASRGSSRQ